MLLQWVDDPAVLGVLMRDELAAERCRDDHPDCDQDGGDDAGDDHEPGRAGRD
jgi:hypothetical protein